MLREYYLKMEGDYADVCKRLIKEERISRFVLKFLDDNTFQMLCEAKEAGDYEEVFRAIHTLKGVSQNLGFTKLYKACQAMTEAVRGGVPLKDEALFAEVAHVYKQTIEVIREYKDACMKAECKNKS